MIFKYKDKEYRFLISAFDVKTQRMSVVYIQIESGLVFTRDEEDFYNKFELVERKRNAQANINKKT